MAATLSPASKTCKYSECGAVFEPKAYHYASPARWAEQEFCTPQCGRRARPRVVPESKVCEFDGCTFTRDPSREGPNTFAARRYGSEACAQGARAGRTAVPRVRTRPKAQARPKARPRTPEPVIPVVVVDRVLWRPNAYGWDPSGPRVA